MNDLSRLLLDVEDALESIPELNTVSIGVEAGITSKDVKAARIVLNSSELSQPQQFYDSGQLDILLFLDVKNDLRLGWFESINLQYSIREKLQGMLTYYSTIYNSFADSPFFVTTISFNLSGVRNTLAGECVDPLAGP